MNREATDKELSGGVVCDGMGSTAAALFGVAEDVMDLKPIALKSEQVPVLKDQHGVWRAAEKLTVDRFARAEDGHIHMLQLALASGKKVLWDEATL